MYKMLSAIILVCVLSLTNATEVAYSKSLETQQVLQATSIPTIQVTSSTLNIRLTPNGAIIGVLKLNQRTQIYGETIYLGNVWYKVKWGTRYGYVHSYYTKVVITNPIQNYASVVSVDTMALTIAKLANKDNARIAGTSSEKLAGDYIQTNLTNSGYVVQRQWFPTWVKLASGARGANTTSSNVFAKSKNFNATKKTIILMAHYDSVYTPGADDNASGTAMVMELARYLNTRSDLNVNVVMLLTGAEEGRHHGSLYYASHPIVPLASTALVINLDMVGAGAIYQIYNYKATMSQSYYARYTLSLGKALGLNTISTLSSWSDHTSFELKNVPSVTFMNLKSYSYYHTDYDTPSRISKTTLRNISNMVLNLIEEVNRK